MKKTYLLSATFLLFALACNKKTDDPKPANNTNNNTSPSLDGSWTVKTYDNMDLVAPAAGTLKITSSSAGAGNADLDITFDGKAHSTENDTYTFSNNNANITFSKTGGNFTVLSGGGTWTVDSFTTSLFKIKSQYGMIIRMTK
ncbi:MAG: hypothetical protein ACTHKV_04275 [Flavipsychrobacter sp.]